MVLDEAHRLEKETLLTRITIVANRALPQIRTMAIDKICSSIRIRYLLEAYRVKKLHL